MSGRLVVVSGPGGAGKGTVVRALTSRYPEVSLSVSATTRPPRPGERDGVDYHFLDDAAFDDLVGRDGFLEWATFAGHRYGTPWTSVREALERARYAVLEIDVQGARQVRETLPEATQVFIAPPSVDELRERLEQRGSDSPEQIQRRLGEAPGELAAQEEFPCVVVNDDLARAQQELVDLAARVSGR